MKWGFLDDDSGYFYCIIYTVLLFVRERKKETNNVAMSFTFLGKAHIVRWSGSQPMTILYKLDNPIPAKYITTTDSSGVL